MKFKVQATTSANQLSISDSKTVYSKLANPSAIQIEDLKEFQKLVYQSVQQFLATKDHQSKASLVALLNFVNAKQELNKIANMVFHDIYKQTKNKVYKQQSGLSQDKQLVLMVKGLVQIVDRAQLLESQVFKERWLLKGLFSYWEQNEVEFFKGLLSDLVKLIFTIGRDSPSNMDSFMLGILSFLKALKNNSNRLALSMEALLLGEFTELEHPLDVYSVLQKHLQPILPATLTSIFQTKISTLLFQQLPQQIANNLRIKNYQEVMRLFLDFSKNEQLIQKFFQLFAVEYKNYVRQVGQQSGDKTRHQSVIKTILELYESFKENLSSSLLTPTFLAILIQINIQLMREYNGAQEISQYFQDQLGNLTEEAVIQVLLYATDKDRLELQLRKYLLTRVIEGQLHIEEEKALSQHLQNYFGKNFVHRFNLIFSELADSTVVNMSDKVTVKTIPSAVWINEIANPQRKQVIHNCLLEAASSFSKQYSYKFKSRTLSYLSTVGSVALILDKKFEIKVNTQQASILLFFNDKRSYTIDQLCDEALQIDKEYLKFLCAPLIESQVLSIKDAQDLTIGQPISQKVDCYLTSIDCIRYYQSKHLNLLDGAQTNSESTPKAYPYVRKEHKHKVQAYIIRAMKHQQKLLKSDLEMKTIEKYRSENLIEMTKEDILAVVKELQEKEYIREEGGSYLYTP